MIDVKMNQKVINQANEQKECSTKKKSKNINDSLNHDSNNVKKPSKYDRQNPKTSYNFDVNSNIKETFYSKISNFIQNFIQKLQRKDEYLDNVNDLIIIILSEQKFEMIDEKLNVR